MWQLHPSVTGGTSSNWLIKVCSSLSQRAVDLQAGEVAAQAFRRSAELGLSPGTIQVQGFVYGPVAAWTGTRTHLRRSPPSKISSLLKLFAPQRRRCFGPNSGMCLMQVQMVAKQLGTQGKLDELLKLLAAARVRMRSRSSTDTALSLMMSTRCPSP